VPSRRESSVLRHAANSSKRGPIRIWIQYSLHIYCVHGMFPYQCAVKYLLPTGPSWQIRSSSRRKPARPKTSAPQLVLVTVMFFQRKAICSISSNRRTLFRPGSDGRRYFYDLKVFTERARQRAATRPLSSRPFARHCALPNEFGFKGLGTGGVSWSVKKFLGITSMRVRSGGCFPPRRISNPPAPRPGGKTRIPNPPAYTPLP